MNSAQGWIEQCGGAAGPSVRAFWTYWEKEPMNSSLGGMLQRMNAIAAHGDAVAKWARMTDAQHWAAHLQESAGASPPYALPPYVFLNAGPMLDGVKVGAEARSLYKRRSP